MWLCVYDCVCACACVGVVVGGCGWPAVDPLHACAQAICLAEGVSMHPGALQRYVSAMHCVWRDVPSHASLTHACTVRVVPSIVRLCRCDIRKCLNTLQLWCGRLPESTPPSLHTSLSPAMPVPVWPPVAALSSAHAVREGASDAGKCAACPAGCMQPFMQALGMPSPLHGSSWAGYIMKTGAPARSQR